MNIVSDTLTVTFDSSLDDEAGICVSRVVNGKIVVLKMELGEQANILYQLLTDQMTKAEIKAEGNIADKQDGLEAIRQEIKKKLYRDSEWNEWVIREKDVMDIVDKHIQKPQDIPVMDYPQVEGVTPIVVSTDKEQE